MHIQTMPQSNFDLSDDFLNLKSYVTNTSFAPCTFAMTSKAPKKSKDMATLYPDFVKKL